MFTCTNKIQTHAVLKKTHTHTHIFSDRQQTGGPITSTSPQLPELPSPARHHLAPLLAHLGCLCWGVGVLGSTLNSLPLSFPLFFLPSVGFPRTNRELKLGRLHQMWTFGTNLAGDATDAAFPALSHNQLKNVTSYAFLYCHPIAEAGRGWKEINLPWCHWGSGLVLQSFLLSTEFRQRPVFPPPPFISAAFYQFS